MCYINVISKQKTFKASHFWAIIGFLAWVKSIFSYVPHDTTRTPQVGCVPSPAVAGLQPCTYRMTHILGCLYTASECGQMPGSEKWAYPRHDRLRQTPGSVTSNRVRQAPLGCLLSVHPTLFASEPKVGGWGWQRAQLITHLPSSLAGPAGHVTQLRTEMGNGEFPAQAQPLQQNGDRGSKSGLCLLLPQRAAG